MKKFRHYLVAFLLPILLFSLAFKGMNIYPFGNISLRTSDSLYQYPSFFEGLRQMNLFTFNLGLGANFFPVFTTYIASPLNLIYLFFKNYQFDTFYSFLILFKIGLIGLSMNYLLNYKKELNKKSWLFSTIYALSGFISLYYWNFQFLDAIYMLPLIMIGIDKLVNDNKNLMYFITLAFMIMIHYYTAYMICIFSVIYFFFLLYNSNFNKKEKKQKIIKFFVTSLFCGLTAACLLIPTIFSFFQGRNSYFVLDKLLGINKNGIVSLYNLTGGAAFLVDNYCNVCFDYISIFSLTLLILLFLDKKTYSKKYKKSLLAILIIFLLSIFTNFFYCFWHMFQVAIGIPGRFIFCFQAFFILITYNYFLDKKDDFKLSKKMILIVSLFLLIVFLILFTLKISIQYQGIYKTDKVYFILFVINIVLFIYYLIFFNKEKLKYLTYFIVILELFINLIMNINLNYLYIEYQYAFVDSAKKNVIDINNMISNIYSNEDFIRVEAVAKEQNFNLFYQYYGVNRYSSIYNYNLNTFLEKYHNSSYFYDHALFYESDYLMNALLGVKYLIYRNDKINLIKNDYAIESLGFLSTDTNKEALKTENLAINILNLITDNKYALNEKNIEASKKYENSYEKDGNYELIDKTKDGKVILNYNFNENAISLILADNSLFYFRKEDNKILNKMYAYSIYDIYLNDVKVPGIYEIKKGDKVRIEIKIPKDLVSVFKDDEYVNYVNADTFKKLINDLNEHKIENIKINKKGFTGEFEATDDKNLLLLTIPYDDGIEIKIDGVTKPIEKYLNGAIGLDVERGKHTIEMIYHIKGLKIGIAISLISLGTFIILKSKKKI